MRRLRFFSAAALLAITTPAYADKIFAATPSGSAETLFPDKPEQVIGKLSSACIDRQWTVRSTTANELVCESPMTFGQSLLGQMALGNSYSTPPHRYFRFSVAEINGISRVQASGWLELQMAFGQIQRSDFAGAQFQNGIMDFMLAAGGKYPTGTSFPNNVMMGVQFEAVAGADGQELHVKVVEPGSAAGTAGVLVDDQIVSIAGKRFKNNDQFLGATAKAAETPRYEVQVMRGKQPLKLSLERKFRPSVTEVISPNPLPPAPALVSSSPPSVADELAKLVKLRDQGIITADEFSVQKKKVLER